MLLAVSELSLVITEDYLGAAIELLRRVESNMKFVYMSAGANQHAELYLRILSAIKSVEFVEYHELLQFFMKDVDEEDFVKIITTMQSAKYIQQTSSISEKGKPIRKIQITQTGRKLFDRYDGGM
jgi:hypothetical protein